VLRTPLALLSVFSLAFFTACNDTPTPTPAPTLEVSPLQISALAGDAATALEAKVSGSSAAVLWTLEGAGTLSNLKGTVTKYTPPTELNAVSSAKITVVLEGTKLSQLVNVTLTPKPKLVITPAADLSNVFAGGSKIRFSVAVSSGKSKQPRLSVRPPPQWTLEGPGSIDPILNTFTDYTPPAEVNMVTPVKLTVRTDGLEQSFSFNVQPRPIVPTLTLSPSSQTFTAGATGTAFTATLLNSTEALAWTLTGPGTLSSTTGKTVTYTPPSSVSKTETATLIVRAGALSQQATLTVQPAPKLTVSPSSATFTAGDAGQSFTATLENSSEPINWTLEGVGSLSSTTGKTVVYNPPSSVTREETVKLTARAGQVFTLSTLTIKPGVRITGLATQGTYAIQEPEVGVEVAELGQPLVKSSADGTFSFTVSRLPYNLMVMKSNQYGRGAEIFYAVNTKQIRIYDDKLDIEDKFQSSLTTIKFSTEPDIVNEYPKSYDSTTAKILVTSPQGKIYTLYSFSSDGNYEKKMLCSVGPTCVAKVIVQRYRKEGNIITTQIGETDNFTISPGKSIDLGKIILESFDTKRYEVQVENNDKKLYTEYSSVFLSKTLNLSDLNYYGKLYQEADGFAIYIPNLNWKIKYFRPYVYSGNLTFGAQKNSSLLLKTDAFLNSAISLPNTFLPSPEISSTTLGGVLDVKNPVTFNFFISDQIRQFRYSGKDFNVTLHFRGNSVSLPNLSYYGFSYDTSKPLSTSMSVSDANNTFDLTNYLQFTTYTGAYFLTDQISLTELADTLSRNSNTIGYDVIIQP